MLIDRPMALSNGSSTLAGLWSRSIPRPEKAESLLTFGREWPERRCDYLSPSVETLMGYTSQEHYPDPRPSLTYLLQDDLLASQRGSLTRVHRGDERRSHAVGRLRRPK